MPDRVLVDARTTTRGAYSFKSRQNIKDMEDKKKKEKPVINLDEIPMSRELLKFRGVTITDEDGNEILHSLRRVE